MAGKSLLLTFMQTGRRSTVIGRKVKADVFLGLEPVLCFKVCACYCTPYSAVPEDSRFFLLLLLLNISAAGKGDLIMV